MNYATFVLSMSHRLRISDGRTSSVRADDAQRRRRAGNNDESVSSKNLKKKVDIKFIKPREFWSQRGIRKY